MKRWLQLVVVGVLRRFGLLLIPARRVSAFLLTERLRRIIDVYRIDCFLDVGAHRGEYHDFLRGRVGYQGLVISFEPNPRAFAELEVRARGDASWRVYGYALGSESARARLNVMADSTFSSFRQPDHSGTTRFKTGNQIATTAEVETRRLDEVLPELREQLGFRRVFLKMDMQGFDLEVFRGAERCLDLIQGVQSEVSVLPIYRDAPQIGESLAVFKSKGFEVSGLYPVSESRFPHEVEFDCVLLPQTESTKSFDAAV